MILTELPDLLPRPQTTSNAAFRRRFYERWGRENWVVSGAARRAEYARYRQCLSVKCVAGGSERYFTGRRDLRVSDHSWLVLNSGSEYGSLIQADSPVYTFCLFFRPGLAAEVAAACRELPAQSLDRGGQVAPADVAFHEQLRPHDAVVTPVIRRMRRAISLGERDADWLEEQFSLLLAELIRADYRHARARDEALRHLRPATRREIARRVLVAEAFMREHLDHPLTLRTIAGRACLSPYHLLRRFRELHGITPASWLRNLRVQRALRLREDRAMPLQDIASATGLSRASLWRALRSVHPAKQEVIFSEDPVAPPSNAGSVHRTASSSSRRRRRSIPRAGAHCHPVPAST